MVSASISRYSLVPYLLVLTGLALIVCCHIHSDRRVPSGVRPLADLFVQNMIAKRIEQAYWMMEPNYRFSNGIGEFRRSLHEVQAIYGFFLTCEYRQTDSTPSGEFVDSKLWYRCVNDQGSNKHFLTIEVSVAENALWIRSFAVVQFPGDIPPSLE